MRSFIKPIIPLKIARPIIRRMTLAVSDVSISLTSGGKFDAVMLSIYPVKF